MAQELLFQIKLDTSDSEAKTIALTKSINDLTAAQKKNTQSTDEEIIAYEKNAAELKNLKSEREAHRKALAADQAARKSNQQSIESEIKAYNSSGKSLNENRRALADQKKAYADLKNPSKEATASLKALNDKVKEQEQAFGDNQRNVGNYSDFLKGNFKGGINAAKNSFSAFNETLTKNPIGILVPLFFAFRDILAKNDDLAEKFEQTVAGINAVFDVLVGRVIKATKAVGDFIVGFATGDIEQIKKGFTGLKDSVAGVTDEITQGVKGAVEYTKALQEIEDEQTAVTKANAKSEASFENLIIQAKNATATDAERVKALQDARKANQDLAASETAIAQKRIDAIQRELDRRTKAGLKTDDILREQADAEQELIEIQAQAANRNEKIQNAIDKRNEDIAAAQAKRIEQAKKDEEALARAREEIAKREAQAIQTLQNLQDQSNLKFAASLEEKRNIEIEIAQRRRDEILESDKALDSERALALEQFRQTEISINQNYDKLIFDAELKKREDAEGLELARAERLVTQQEIELQAEQKLLEDKGQITAAFYTKIDELAQAQIATEVLRRENDLNNFGLTETQKEEIVTKSNRNIIAINQATTNKIGELQKKEVAMRQLAATNSIATATNLLNATTSLAKEGSEAQKALQIANTIIATYASATSAYQSVVGTPYVGPVLGAVAAGTAVALGLANVAEIAGVEFADGGIVEGPSHANGGVKFAVGGRVVELEGGEAVINKKSTAMFGNTLSQINAAGGGVKFADGGVIGNNLNNQAKNQLTPDFEKILRMIPAPVVSVVDFEIVQNQRVSVIDQATL